MSGENFPRVAVNIAVMCASNQGVRKDFAQFENELKRKEELSVIKLSRRRTGKNLEMNLMVLRDADKVKQEAQQQIVDIERKCSIRQLTTENPIVVVVEEFPKWQIAKVPRQKHDNPIRIGGSQSHCFSYANSSRSLRRHLSSVK